MIRLNFTLVERSDLKGHRVDLPHAIGHILPLEDARQAYERAREGRGRVVLKLRAA